MSKRFLKRYIGQSRDRRANRWRLTCPVCGHAHEPTTTRLRFRSERCPKCDYIELVDYDSDMEGA